MLLAIDIGNSRTKFGVFDGERLHTKFSVPTSIGSADDLAAAFGSLQVSIDAAIACSVVPEAEASISRFLESRFSVMLRIVRNDADLGIGIRYEPPETAGTDRLINCFAAAEQYGVPCIVCSFGTATTIDVLSPDRTLLGGLIAPGMRVAAKALEMAASRLPEVEIERPDRLLGNNTGSSIRSGLFYSQIGLIETAVRRIRTETGIKGKVVATGGFAPLIAPDMDVIDVWDEDLTLTGLRLVHVRPQPV